MSTPGPDDPTAPSQPSPELGGLDPKDLLNAGLETMPPITLPPQPADSDATIAVASPRPSQPGAGQVELPLPEELTNLLPHGNYVVESFLGQGGMGAVYKGMQIRLKRPVAIKIMRRDLGKDHDFEARFEREAQAMAKLNHPNIVSVIDFGEAGPDYLYIVMELIDGADLMDVIRGGQMTQEMALSLLPQICDALQFAHDHGIVHRDIKPSNIMLTRDGRIKMADFGLAKHFDAESSFRTQTGTGMGTPDYAAPEQFSPDTPIDHRADIYALGVMIYQMITGQLPRGAWKPPSQRVEVDPHWDDIVSRAMQNDPADRYQQASEVKTDVSSIPLVGAGRAAGPSAAASSPTLTTAPNAALAGASALPKTQSRAPLLFGLIGGAAALTLGILFVLKKPAPTNSPAQAADAVPASAQDASDAKASRTKASTASIQWQKANWTEEDLKKKTIVADGDWARIGQKAGTPNGWAISAKGENVSFKDGVVRLRYRWEGGRVALKIRHVGSSYGQVVIWGQNLDLSIHIESPGGRVFEKATLPRPLNDGDEGTLEIAAIGKRLYARINNSIVFASPEIPELSPDGFCGVHSENGTFRDVEYAILDGIADPLKALGWEVPPTATAASLDWKKAIWTEEDLKKKTIVADGDWARIGQKAGAANGWRIGANGQTVVFKDGVVRLRYRWEGEAISLKTRNENTFGQVLLWGPHVDLGIFLNSSETRLFQKVTLPEPLKVGDEGTLEIAAIGNRLYARLNDSVVLSSPEIPELVPSGYCAIQSVNTSFRDIEYAILDGIPDPLKALGWEVPNAVETALASVSPAVRPYVAYPERLKVPVPDWLRLASAVGGPLAIHTIGDPGPAKAALDLGEAARFDDFVFVAGQTYGWIAVRRNGELWGRNADYSGSLKSVGPIQIKSLSTGMHCHWLEEDGTGGSLYGASHHRWPVSRWGSERVTAASLHSGVAFFLEGKAHRLAFDSAGVLLAHFSEVIRPEYQFPPVDWFRGAPLPMAGDGMAALTHDGRVRTWDFTTGTSFPGMDEVRGVVQLAYGSGSVNLGVMLSETGQATVFGPKGSNVPENAIPPATAGPFIRVSPGPIFAAQKTDGSWIGWNSGEPDLAAAVAGLGPVISIASRRVGLNQGIHAEKPVTVPYLIYIQSKNRSDSGFSNATPATTAPANPSTPLAKPLTWLPAVHSDGNAAKYHSETPDGWVTGTPDNPGGIKVTHPAGPLGNFAVRLRYRWNQGSRQLQVRVREPGRVVAGAVLFNDHWAITKYDVNSPPETRTQSLTTRKRTAKLEPGFEGMLEVAVIGDRVIARFDNTTLLDATVTGMATRGVAHISSAGLSFRDVEMASLEGIADPLKALGWEVPLNWQKAAWAANEVAQKKVVVEDGWARIGQAAGALEKTWKLAVNGTPASLGDGAVRLRYRFEGRALTLKIRNHTTYGYVTLWPSRLDLGIWSTAYAEREKRVQTRALATPLKDGEEGVLELAAAGRRLFARLNGSIVLTSEDLPDLGLTGGCEIQSDGVSFRDVEYLHLDGIADPLKALGWEEAAAQQTGREAWNDFFEEWDRNPDRNDFERGSLKRFPDGWHPAGAGGANAYLMDSQGRDLAIRTTAKFDSLPESKDNDQITVRVRRRQGSAPGKYNEYAGYLFRNGSAELQIVDDSGTRILKSPDLVAGFDPHQFHTLELSTHGDQVSFHVDGFEIASLKNGTLPPGGRFGINGSQSVVFQKAEYRFLEAPKGNPATATKENPFVNTLGMKFVPVPITGGPTDGQRVLFSIWETRVQDYEVFAKETRRQWPKPEFEQGPPHPAVNLQWLDATAYCAWLTERERKLGEIGPQEVYRLPTDHEWSCAVGAGDKEDALKLPQEKHLKLVGQLPWGTAWPPPAGSGNFSGEEADLNPARRPTQKILPGYRDEFIATAEVGSFPSNRLGIFDLVGNAWEWCEDWFDASKSEKIFRGGAWDSADHGALQVSSRFKNAPINFNHSYGFRVVLAPAAH